MNAPTTIGRPQSPENTPTTCQPLSDGSEVIALREAWDKAKARVGSPPEQAPVRTPEVQLDAAIAQFMAELPTPRNPSPELAAERKASFALACWELRRDSRVDARYAKATLRELGAKFTDEQRRELASYLRVGALLEGLIDNPQLIAIGGPRGTGKTYLACALANDFCRLRRPAMYRTVVEYFDALRDAFGAGGTEPERVRRSFERPDLLVLDEVQLRDQDRAWQDSRLTELIDKRYREMKATVLLSNLTPAELNQNLGPSIQRRLNEEGGIVEANWRRVQEVLSE